MTQTARCRDWLAASYDRLCLRPNKVRFEHWIVKLAVIGFVVHLALIFLSSSLPQPQMLVAALGKDYLSAILTPLSIILFYEVAILIAAIPQSTVQSVASQYEIVSLIFIRGFFKDVAAIDDLGALRQPSAAVMPILADVGAALVMFLLVSIFRHISIKEERSEASLVGPVASLGIFVARKKAIALALTAWLAALTLYTLADFCITSYRVLYEGAVIASPPAFYVDVFTVMIFTDVLILILSLVVSDRYELVFRNAAFVISTILIRLSLTTVRPYGAPLALAGMAVGIFAMLTYCYNTSVTRLHRDTPIELNGTSGRIP